MGSMQGGGEQDGAQSTQSSAYRMKISAIRNPIPEPPPVMKATLSLREENRGSLKRPLLNGGGEEVLLKDIDPLHWALLSNLRNAAF